VRPRSDAATDGDRWGRVIFDGGPDQTLVRHCNAAVTETFIHRGLFRPSPPLRCRPLGDLRTLLGRHGRSQRVAAHAPEGVVLTFLGGGDLGLAGGDHDSVADGIGWSFLPYGPLSMVPPNALR
jgi:hypothetical protein